MVKRLCLLLLIAGCTASPPPPSRPPVPPLSEDTCGANTYASLVGQDATALEKVLILGMVRVTRPGDAVTLDFRPMRINFGINQNEKIASISCG